MKATSSFSLAEVHMSTIIHRFVAAVRAIVARPGSGRRPRAARVDDVSYRLAFDLIDVG